MGASRSRIVRHLLSESLVLALTGGAAGVLIAVLGVRAFAAFGPGDIPRMAEISVNFRVLGFAVAVSALAGILFGFLPALRTTRISLLANLGKGAAGSSASGPGRSRLQSAFVVVQTGMALVLLTGAGLLLNSLARLVQVDPGFDPGNVTVMHLSLGTGYQTKEQRTAFFTQLLDNLRALPGVESAGLCSGIPFGVSAMGGQVVFEEADVSSGSSLFRLVSDGFLSTIGVDVLAGGRPLSPQDILAGAPVVLVNKAFADKYWPGQEAVGKSIKISTEKDAPWLEVAGITPSFKQMRLGWPVRSEVFVPYTQLHFIRPSMDFAVRSSLEPQGLARSLRNAVWSVDPNQPVDWISSLQQRISLSLSQPRFYAILLSLFAALALILAAVGIYGTLSFWVSQRTCELSIRMALGASGRRLAAGVLRQGLALVLAGTAIGLAASSLASRTLSSFLYGVSPTDWMTFTAVSLFLVLTATAAISLPARRAMQV
ncbi:MAG: FtsX-like permease family protein, partial [Acidobacteriota bacterium]